ncbi:MAG: hypothetical protein ACBZ72_01445 [Candidatus Bathyarchaeia archaeon]
MSATSNQTRAGINYAVWNGTNWTTQKISPTGSTNNKIAIDPNNKPHIVYQAYDGLKHIFWNGTNWITQTVYVPPGMGWVYFSVAIDSSGNPHIVYATINLPIDELRYTVWTGSNWNTTTIDSGSFPYWAPSITLDSHDIPHITYFDQTNMDLTEKGTLKYATPKGSNWSIQTVDTPFYSQSSLALDSKGYPHISYTNASNDGLEYTSWDGTAWIKQTVDADWDFHGDCYLGLDSDDKPQIAYFVAVGEECDLKYAVWTGENWSIQLVDSNTASGAMVLDSSGNPHIAYNRPVIWASGNASRTYDLTYATLSGGRPNSSHSSNPSASPTIPELSEQVLGTTLFVFGLTATFVVVSKKKMANKSPVKKSRS